jgi:hypothetical protein
MTTQAPLSTKFAAAPYITTSHRNVVWVLRQAPEKVAWMSGVVVPHGSTVTPGEPSWSKALDQSEG